MLRCLVSGLFLLYVICGCEKEKPGAEQRGKGKGVGMAVAVQWLGHASFRISAMTITRPRMLPRLWGLIRG
jgi:hypothetical protein